MDLLRCTDLLVIERDFESQNWKKFKRRGEILNVFLDPGRQIPQAIPQGTKKPLTNLRTVKDFGVKLWCLQYYYYLLSHLWVIILLKPMNCIKISAAH